MSERLNRVKGRLERLIQEKPTTTALAVGAIGSAIAATVNQDPQAVFDIGLYTAALYRFAPTMPTIRNAFAGVCQFASGKALPVALAAALGVSAIAPEEAHAADRVNKAWQVLGVVGGAVAIGTAMKGIYDNTVGKHVSARSLTEEEARSAQTAAQALFQKGGDPESSVEVRRNFVGSNIQVVLSAPSVRNPGSQIVVPTQIFLSGENPSRQFDAVATDIMRMSNQAAQDFMRKSPRYQTPQAHQPTAPQTPAAAQPGGMSPAQLALIHGEIDKIRTLGQNMALQPYLRKAPGGHLLGIESAVIKGGQTTVTRYPGRVLCTSDAQCRDFLQEARNMINARPVAPMAQFEAQAQSLPRAVAPEAATESSPTESFYGTEMPKPQTGKRITLPSFGM